MNKIILKGIFGSLALIALVFGAWYLYFKTPATIEYTVENTPTAVLVTQNEDYATAIAYENSSKYDLALLSYQKALPIAKDQVQITQIRVKIAFMTERLGNFKDAIAEFKKIAADTSNYAIARAISVQEIGAMYNVYSDANSRQIILAETFKDSPYDSFKEDANLNIAYTKLFEYATSLYPLGYSEAFVAYGYAVEIGTALHGATTTPQGEAYLSLIRQSVQAADVDIQRMKLIPGEAVLVPKILIRQGITQALLVAVGAADPQQAEFYYKSGVAYDITLGNKPGNLNTYVYAAFLAHQYGNKRSEDIKTLLLPFRIGNDALIYPNVVNFYKMVRMDATLTRDKQRLVQMGRIDPDFKTYLISLGWKSSDF